MAEPYDKRGKAPTQRILVGLAVATSLIALVQIGRIAILGHYGTDEYTYAHAAWAIAHGQEPYRDFLLHHFPLVMQLGSLAFRIEDEPGAMQLLRWGMVPVWLLTAGAATWIGSRRGAWTALATLPILAALRTWVAYGTQFRPDALAIALFALAVGCTLHRGRRSEVVAGVAWTAAVWASQKVLVYGSFLWLVVCIDDFAAPRRLRFPTRFAAGAFAAAIPVAAYLTATRNWEPWVRWCYDWGLVHEQLHSSRSLWRSFRPTARHDWGVLALAAIGIADAVRRSWRDRDRDSIVLLAAFVFTTGSFAMQRAAFGWSLVAPLTFVAVLAARAVGGIADRLRGSAATVGIAAMIVAGTVASAWPSHTLARPKKTNLAQREKLDRIGRVTSITDPVYDNTGRYVARPHVGFLFFTDDTVRRAMADHLAQVVPDEILSSGATVALRDKRDRSLPTSLRGFLDAHFVDVGGDLRLWGKHFDPDDDDDTFLATRDGLYYVFPAEGAPSITVDGAHVDSDVFPLGRGEHRIDSLARVPFTIAWLPRDGSKPAPQTPKTK